MKMNKRSIVIFATTLGLLFSMTMPATVSANTIHDVYPGESIQACVDVADSGDIIVVHAGTYSELVCIYKDNITLRGDGAILDGTDWSNWEDGLVTISSGNYGITIEGFEIRNHQFGDHGGNGIFVESDSHGNTLRNNTIHDVNGAGIFLGENTSGNLVTGNRISTSENGVGANNSHSNQIVGNVIEDSSIGIYMSNGCSNNTINDNDDSGSNYGIFLSGANNIVKGNSIVGITEVGLHLVNANYNQILNNTIVGQGLETQARGIVLEVKGDTGVSTSNNNIKGNDISAFKIGIALDTGVAENVVQDNSVNDSTKVGISLGGALNNIIKENLVNNSGVYGIAVVAGSSRNTLKENKVKKSEVFDLFDDGSGTNNIWRDNKFNTSNL